MHQLISKAGLVLGIHLIALGLLGCSSSTEESTEESTTTPKSPAASPPVAAGPYAHSTHGPHQGSLIELGNEQYYAELIHDEDAETVTIYILDASAKTAVPIEATELMINLSDDGEALQFSLAANPDTDDPAGKASRFVSTDSELAEEFDHAHSSAQLVVTISGKQFRGAIEHGDEDDHDHAHE